MVAAAILASGLSTRMGRPKALLPARPAGESFVGTLVSTLSSAALSRILVVGRPGDEGLRQHVRALGVRFVDNPEARDGQLSSIVAALDALAAADEALLVVPVDLPQVSPDTVARLLAAWVGAPERIVRPLYAGRHGHPVIFPRPVFAALRAADRRVGARAVVRAAVPAPLDVPCDDSGVVEDVDTPEDYRRLIDPAGLPD